MADVVNGKYLVLYAQIGADLLPFACAKNFDMVITTEAIELAPKTDSTFRAFKPGKKDIKFNGGGLIKLVQTGINTTTSIVVAQLAGQTFKVRFSLTDPQNNEVYYECDVMVLETNQSKTSGSTASYTFSLQAIGKVTIVGGTNVGGVFTQQYTTQFV
jgi:hypothetical protein